MVVIVTLFVHDIYHIHLQIVMIILWIFMIRSQILTIVLQLFIIMIMFIHTVPWLVMTISWTFAVVSQLFAIIIVVLWSITIICDNITNIFMIVIMFNHLSHLFVMYSIYSRCIMNICKNIFISGVLSRLPYIRDMFTAKNNYVPTASH